MKIIHLFECAASTPSRRGGAGYNSESQKVCPQVPVFSESRAQRELRAEKMEEFL